MYVNRFAMFDDIIMKNTMKNILQFFPIVLMRLELQKKLRLLKFSLNYSFSVSVNLVSMSDSES